LRLLIIHINMLFRDKNGKLIEVNKKDFIHDHEYYNKIASIQGIHFNLQNNQTSLTSMNTILRIVK